MSGRPPAAAGAAPPRHGGIPRPRVRHRRRRQPAALRGDLGQGKGPAAPGTPLPRNSPRARQTAAGEMQLQVP